MFVVQMLTQSCSKLHVLAIARVKYKVSVEKSKVSVEISREIIK